MNRFALAAVLLSAGYGPAPAQTPENAFIIVIDGMRDDEGFGAESLYLRHTWNDLRPLGTVNTRFWNRGWTATTGGHTTILSGVRQILRNNGGVEQDVRSFDPLVYEYYRKAFGAPESSCGVVVGKWGNVGAIADFGLEPSYGEPLQGFQIGDPTNSSDTFCSQRVHRTLDSLHPRLMLVNLGDVDHYGHQDTWSKYTGAIRTADSIIYEFYKHIQAIPPYTDTFYRNKTVLIVTSDHGRHDDAHGGFAAHGEWDHGCRQIGFLAIGPGIAQNRVVTWATGDQIDIVPTIAAMLGFPAPFAEGRVMTELFAPGYAPKPVPGEREPVTDAVNLSATQDFSRDPDICRDHNGNLYLVWSERSGGNWGVRFRKSTDNGTSWSSAQALFNFPAAESMMWYARVAADDSLAVSAMGFGKHLNPIDSLPPSRMDTTFIWYPWLATSTDAGATWSTTSLLDSSMGSYYAPVTVKNGRYGVAWWACGQFAWQTPRNGIFFNGRVPNGAWRSTPAEPSGRQSIHLAMADDGNVYHIAATAFDGEDYDLVYLRSTDAGTSWNATWVARDTASDPWYDYDPELVVDDSGMVHLFWSRKANSGGAWQIMCGRRNPATGVFDTFRLTSSTAGAWQPHAAVKGNTVALVWLDYRDGNPEVYYSYSPDRGLSWSAPERITYTEGLTQHPRVAATNRGFYLVWQDLQSGNWEIYGRELDAGSGRDVGIVRIDAPQDSIDSIAAITPRATFRNDGPMTATFKALFTINDLLGATVYFDSTTVVDLAPSAAAAQSFPVWLRPHALGSYTARCSTYLVQDSNPSNDTASGAFSIIPPLPGWHERASMPVTPSGKFLKDGAWLAYDPGSGLVYGAKGYKTGDFYSYSPDGDTWHELATVARGTEAKPPYKGAVGVADGLGGVYATKGNNTQGFYRYDVSGNTWGQVADVPLGTTRKKVKGGTDAVYVEKSPAQRYVYLLKGYKNEFWRYNTTTDSWQSLPDAPYGTNPKYNNGSFLAYDGDHTIYCHKSKYHELWSYDTDRDTWNPAPLKPMPLVGRSGRMRKSKDGGCATWLGDGFYAFKGANTQEFWKYYPAGDSWLELDTIPSVGSSHKRKRVKNGADMVGYADGVILALKGNRCNELWRYVVPARSAPLDADRPERSGIQAQSATGNGNPELTLVPNPLASGFVRLKCALPGAAVLRLTISDAAGRVVLHRTLGATGTVLDVRDLAPGVYLARIESSRYSATKKLVVR